jgi:hypothetical protein
MDYMQLDTDLVLENRKLQFLIRANQKRIAELAS